MFYLAVYDYLIGMERRSMIPLLLLIQFAEMKSAVNKEVKEEKLVLMCYKGTPLLSTQHNHHNTTEHNTHHSDNNLK